MHLRSAGAPSRRPTLDPRVQELHVLEATGPGERFEGAPSELICPQPFGVPFDLGRLWQRLPVARR